MKKDTHYLAIGFNLKTEYKDKTTLQAFLAYIKMSLIYSQHVLNIKKINYHTLVRDSVNDLINETSGFVDYVVMGKNDVALYLNDEIILVSRW